MQTDSDKLNSLVVSCLVEGMPLNLARHSHGNSYQTEVGSEECSIHPSSVLFANMANAFKEVDGV